MSREEGITPFIRIRSIETEMSCEEENEYWTADCCLTRLNHQDLEHENLGSEQNDPAEPGRCRVRPWTNTQDDRHTAPTQRLRVSGTSLREEACHRISCCLNISEHTPAFTAIDAISAARLLQHSQQQGARPTALFLCPLSSHICAIHVVRHHREFRAQGLRFGARFLNISEALCPDIIMLDDPQLKTPELPAPPQPAMLRGDAPTTENSPNQ